MLIVESIIKICFEVTLHLFFHFMHCVYFCGETPPRSSKFCAVDVNTQCVKYRKLQCNDLLEIDCVRAGNGDTGIEFAVMVDECVLTAR